MKRCISIITACLLFVSAQAQVEYVNPMVGTDGHGHTFPGATVPFGMVQLSPDTRLDSWDGCSGYHYSDSIIYGFSHTHLSGTGCLDWGDILFMPVKARSTVEFSEKTYKSTFRHETEHASPGYYEVYLDGPEVLAKLTAGRRTGMHEYRYKGKPYLVIDLNHRDYTVESRIYRYGKNSIGGYRISNSWANNQHVYFYAEFSKSIDYMGYDDASAFISFHGRGILKVRVGISSVSVENARMNLESENLGWNFNRQVKKARAMWNEWLSKIDAKDADEEKLKVFYTALYHTAIHPSLYSDVNGEYRGMDGKVHRADGFERYTVFSIWDTFRALHPLMTIIERSRTLDFLKSFQSIYDEGGKLPIWELSGTETNCMIGYNSVSVIADAMAKGITGFDEEKMFRAMLASSRKAEYGLDVFRNSGLVLGEKEHESVSKTLEYAYDDWCVAQVAHRLGYDNEYDAYMESAQYWRNIFDPSTGFMRPRLNGRWLTPFNPTEVNNHFTEANSWQYSFFVPHDISGHIKALGGEEAYVRKLDELFSASSRTSGRTQADITGLIGQYAHGNEPSHHIAYLYSYAGRPEKTAEMVHRILDTQYSSRPDGLCGNEDCGQMSAWAVMSAMGLYSVCPGSSEMVVTKPWISDVTIHLENGNDFRISKSGTAFDAGSMEFQKILDGGHYSFTLADAARLRPHSGIPQTIVVNPVFEMENEIFLDSMQVCVLDTCYVVRESSTLRATAHDENGRSSFETVTNLHKIHRDMKIELHSRYNPQYNAGGDEGLIDGRRGELNWRTGGWQGYQATDFEAIIDLLSVRDLSAIGAGFCQDARSWIWMPRNVRFSVSEDGQTYTPVARIENTVDPQDYEVQIKDFEAQVNVKARYIKVNAENYGIIPEWHPGSGSYAFIFIDEIWVR